MTASRLTHNEVTLAKKFESIKKPYFIVRAKFDVDLLSAKNKRLKEIKKEMKEEKKDQKQIDEIKIDNIKIDEKKFMNKIKMDYAKDMGKICDRNQDVFLIDNNEPDDWDFNLLVEAIKDELSPPKKESLTLSLPPRSKDDLKNRAEILKGKLNFQFKIIVLCMSIFFK